MVLFNHRLSRCTNVVSAFDGIASMKRTGESDQNGVWILRNREVTIIPTLDEVWLMSTTSTRVSFRYLLFKFWWAILSLFAGDIFFLVFNYVSLNIDIAQVVISHFQTGPDSIQRRTVILATVDHSFLPLITSRRNSLPSSIALVDPRSPKTLQCS